MRRTHALISLLLLALGAACSSSTSPSAKPPASSVPAPDPVRNLIPTGAVQADVMGVKTSARYDALLAKIGAASKSDPNALLDQVKAAAPGEPIPYSPRLGLTKAEYDELLREVDNAHLEKVTEATLRFTPESDSRFRLEGGDALKQLNGVVIDLKRNVVETPLGTCSDRSEFTANDQQPLTGPANGTEWALREGDPASTATEVSFALGRVVASNKVLLLYRGKHVAGGKGVAEVSVAVMYSHAGSTVATTPTTTSTPGRTPIPGVREPQTLRAGESATIPGTYPEPVKVTVFSLRRADPQPETRYTVPGKEFVVADAEACAGPAGSQQGAQAFLFTVVMADRREVGTSTSPWAKKPDLSGPLGDKLAPNECRRGYLTFEVPPGSARAVRYVTLRADVEWSFG